VGWVEESAATLRALTDGDLERLAMLLEPGTITHDAPGRAGLCLHHPDGTCDLWLPRSRRGKAHEHGHQACHVGFADALQQAGVRTWRREKMREEAQAWRWADAYLGDDEEPDPGAAEQT